MLGEKMKMTIICSFDPDICIYHCHILVKNRTLRIFKIPSKRMCQPISQTESRISDTYQAGCFWQSNIKQLLNITSTAT